MDQQLMDSKYNESLATDDFEVHNSFINLLLASSDDASIAYHYDKLRYHENRDLYLRLRAAFIKRGEVGVQYLIQRVADETNPVMRADLLHMLGRLRDPMGLLLARKSLSSSDSDTRHRACYVLGWMGDSDDVSLLAVPLLNDADPYVRRTAATAHSQVFDRLPETKDRLIENLKRAFEAERDDSVIGWIIVTIQYILKKRFGLREDIEEAVLVGDLESAKGKCRQALDRLSKKG